MDSGACDRCGAHCFTSDPISGMVVCESCGLVRDETQFEVAEFDAEGERLGMFMGGCGTASALSGKPGWSMSHGLGRRTDAKKLYGTRKLNDLVSLLRVPKDKADDVKHLVMVLTEDQWGTGRWMDILIASCIYIVARQSHLPLPAVEIAEAVSCGIKELIRMYHRVLDVMDTTLPTVDAHIYFDRVLSQFPAFMNLEKDLARRLSKQGHLLLQCGCKWFLSTGRHPLPVVVAVAVIVAKANRVHVVLEDVSKELRVHPHTSRARLKEFEDSLIGIGQSLPWGKDINAMTINRHLPFLLKYLETRTKAEKNEKKGEHATSHLNISREASKGFASALANEEALVHQHEEVTCNEYDKLSTGSLKLRAHRTLDDMPLKTSSPKEEVRSSKRIRLDNGAFEKIDFPLIEEVEEAACIPTRSHHDKGSAFGNEDGLEEKEALDYQNKQSVWEALPPSFRANKVARAMRHAKIEAAKKRIAEVKQDMAKRLHTDEVSGFTENEREAIAGLNQEHLTILSRTLPVETKGLDEEDLIIQYLLLHGANENLIHLGHYNASLSLVQPEEEVVSDKDLEKYFRSASEIEFLQSIAQEEPIYPWLRAIDL